MPVKFDKDDSRYVEVAVDVPGSPDDVWDAIATGPGVSAWFMPTTIEEREGGEIVNSFGPGMDSTSKITKWDRPNMFVAENGDSLGPGGPTIATEWHVEAKDGGVCTVRVVHRWFADTDQWDKQIEGFEGGWPGFFRILRIFLTHFPGQKSKAFQLTGFAPEPKESAWQDLTGKLGIKSSYEIGETVRSTIDSPQIIGVAENVGEGEHGELLLLKVDEPFTGVAHLFAMPLNGMVMFSLSFYIFGDDAEARVDEHKPIWAKFITDNYPMPADFNPMC